MATHYDEDVDALIGRFDVSISELRGLYDEALAYGCPPAFAQDTLERASLAMLTMEVMAVAPQEAVEVLGTAHAVDGIVARALDVGPAQMS